MIKFLTDNFLLSTETAKRLYHDYAKTMPIVDYHCHINAQEIASDHKFENITQISLGGDHYKWRAMRSNGIDESFITGQASDIEKFFQWAKTLPKAIGNPLYHWTHLELKRYFNYDGVLNADTAQEVWDLCSEKLQTPDLSVRGIIKNSNVKIICTTDDPVDSLEYHTQLASDTTFETKIFPTWRPDRCLGIERPDFADYIKHLADIANTDIKDYSSLTAALIQRLDHFEALGCKSSDHALYNAYFQPADENTVNRIIKRVLTGKAPSEEESGQYKTTLLQFFAREYYKRNWAMQLHFGALRNTNKRMYDIMGPDTGFDCVGQPLDIQALALFFDSLEKTKELPKAILFSINPSDDAAIGALLGCFQGTEAQGKIQQGPSWWFNDTKTGILAQLTSLANLSLLGNFIGMLTDSRSFLSYPRHEYFRRLLCDLIGNWVENNEYPSDIKVLGQMVQDIAYNNALNYFGYIKS
jgi:glucuronate isomerase